MQRRPWLSGPAGGSPRTLCYCPLMSHECAGACAGHCVPVVSLDSMWGRIYAHFIGEAAQL